MPKIWQNCVRSKAPWIANYVYICLNGGALLFLVDKKSKTSYNNNVKDSQTVAWETSHEESPSTTEQECRITSCEGDFKESATEIYRNASCKGGNAG